MAKPIVNQKVLEIGQQKSGNRHVVVLDRGWIFAGDLTEANGRITLTRVQNLRHYREIGLEGAIERPKSSKVTLVNWRDLNFPADVELFRVPVSPDWGLG